MYCRFKKRNTRFMAGLLVLVLILFAAPVAYADGESGTCGPELTWSLKNGTLTISGSGAMTDYSEWELPPWYEQREEIVRLTLPEGLTYVGDMAFYDCMNLTAVVLPSTVREVGELAFCQNRALAMLRLNDGLISLGRSAFEQCEGLYDLRLPNTLNSIGHHAFYLCNGLQSVSVPASVTDMGSGVFAYCKNLVQASVYAQLDALPFWTFYGCDQLSNLYLSAAIRGIEENSVGRCDSLYDVDYGGTQENLSALADELDQELPGFSVFGKIEVGEEKLSASTNDIFVNDDASEVVMKTITVTRTENSTISSTDSQIISDDEVTARVDITASVVTSQGWDEVISEIAKAQETLKEEKADGVTTQKVVVTAYSTADAQPSQTVLEAIAGSDVSFTVHTASGARFTVDGADLNADVLTGSADFSYTLSDADSGTIRKLGVSTAYGLTFSASSNINAKVSIMLPIQLARSTATLCQIERGGRVTQLQSVMVDYYGYAQFYLGQVNADTEYYIAINVPFSPSEEGVVQEVIVPETMYEEYGIADTYSRVEYVITGRTSSWGMNINQVTWIMVAVLVFCAVVVGVVMFMLNKRKLKAGYIPDISKEDYE